MAAEDSTPAEAPKTVFASPMESKVGALPKSYKKKAKVAAQGAEELLAAERENNGDLENLKLRANGARVEKKYYDTGVRRESRRPTKRSKYRSLWANPKSPMKFHSRVGKPVIHASRSVVMFKPPTRSISSTPSTPRATLPLQKADSKPPSKGRRLLSKASEWALKSRGKSDATPKKPQSKSPPAIATSPPPWSYHPPTRKAIEAAKRTKATPYSMYDQVIPHKAINSVLQPPPKRHNAKEGHAQSHAQEPSNPFSSSSANSKSSIRPIASRPSRPQLRDIFTAPAVPTTSKMPRTPHPPLQLEFPPLRKRPTIADFIARGEIPPIPPIPSHFKLEKSSPGPPLSIAIAPPLPPLPNPYGGNAFAPGGFWASRTGFKNNVITPPAPTSRAVVPVGNNNRGHASSNLRASTSRDSIVTVIRAKSSRASLASTIKNKSESHDSSLDTTLISIASSGSSSAGKLLAPVEAWASIGRVPGQYASFEHPFPEFEQINDPDFQLAYYAVLDATVIHYLTFREPEPVSKTKKESSSGSFKSFLTDSRRPSTSRNGSTASFRMFPSLSRKTSFAQDLSLMSTESLASRSTTKSSLPSSLRSKKKKRSNEAEPPVQNNSYERAYKAASKVLKGIKDNFGDPKKFKDFNSHVSLKPMRAAVGFQRMDVSEDRYFCMFNILSIYDLYDPIGWIFCTDEKLPEGDSLIEQALNGNYETMLEKQRAGLRTIYNQRRSEGVDVPTAALNMIWATNFVAWADEAWKNEADRYSKRKLYVEEIRDLVQGANLPPPDDSDEDSDSSITLAMKQYGVEKDVRASTYMNFAEFNYEDHKPDTRLGPAGEGTEGMGPEQQQQQPESDLKPPGAAPRQEDQPKPSEVSEGDTAERKRKNRLTRINMGLQNPYEDSQDLSTLNNRIKSFHAEEDEVLDWEEQLASNLAREKQRQIKRSSFDERNQAEQDLIDQKAKDHQEWADEMERAEAKEEQRRRERRERLDMGRAGRP